MSRLAAALLLLASACAGPAVGGPGQLKVVATVYPLEWLVAEIAPDAVTTSFAARGQDPHDLELSPQQRAGIGSADVVVYLGDIGFQPQVESAIASSEATVVDASAVAGEDRLIPITHDGEDEGVDPHLWFDPRVMADIAVAVGDALAEADAENADDYTSAAQRVAATLTDTAGTLDALLRDCTHAEVVVGHEAFAYLLQPYDIEQHGISEAGGHSEASPQDIANLAAEIQRDGLPAVLSETVEGRTDAEAVAREAGVEVLDVSSLDILTPEESGEDFPELLVKQAQAVASAAECTS